MKRYALGFCFNSDLSEVLLLVKSHPEWQKGLFNGIGGKIESGESPVMAMVREFREEVGLQTQTLEWQQFGVMRFPGGIVWCFAATSDAAHIWALKGTPEQLTEPVHVVPMGCFQTLLSNKATIPNLAWLVPMAKWHLQGNAWPGESFTYGDTP